MTRSSNQHRAGDVDAASDDQRTALAVESIDASLQLTAAVVLGEESVRLGQQAYGQEVPQGAGVREDPNAVTIIRSRPGPPNHLV